MLPLIHKPPDLSLKRGELNHHIGDQITLCELRRCLRQVRISAHFRGEFAGKRRNALRFIFDRAQHFMKDNRVEFFVIINQAIFSFRVFTLEELRIGEARGQDARIPRRNRLLRPVIPKSSDPYRPK